MTRREEESVAAVDPNPARHFGSTSPGRRLDLLVLKATATSIGSRAIPTRDLKRTALSLRTANSPGDHLTFTWKIVARSQVESSATVKVVDANDRADHMTAEVVVVLPPDPQDPTGVG